MKLRTTLDTSLTRNFRRRPLSDPLGSQKTRGEARTILTLFTVQLEIGPETRAMIERVARNMVVQLELGPKTRRTIEGIGIMPQKGKTRGAIEGLLGKGAEADATGPD